MVYTNPYSSGAAALVLVCSITRAVAPSYEVPTLLYIGRRGRVTERAIGLAYYVPSLLQQIDPSYRPDMPTLVCLDLHVG